VLAGYLYSQRGGGMNDVSTGIMVH
jgi:hypothetical protein